MVFHPFEVTIPHVTYALLGAFIVLFGMFSLLLREKLYIGEAIWAFLFGIIIGPYCAGIFDPRAWSSNSDEVTNVITLEFTRVVLAIGVFAIGVELPKAYMAKHWKSLFYLLVPVMTWGWFVSAGLIFALIPSLNFLSSLAIAACLTPTDPILAAAVVGGKWADKHVPAHMRHLLAAESGCNDGAAFPFLFLSLYLLIHPGNTGAAIRDWFLNLWLYQVILGVVIGSLLGYGFRHLMKFCQRHNLIDRHSYVAQYISLAILTIGICTLLGSDDLLAAFACGTAFAWDGFFNKQTEESVFSSVIDLLFNVGAFVFVGAWMPFNMFQNAELTLSVWRLLVIAILILLLRRLPIMILLYRFIPDIKTFREALFAGWFGPIGIGAVFISTLALEVLHNADKEDDHAIHVLEQTIQPIVAFMVLCSIAVHGLSISSVSLGRRVHSVSRTWSRRDTLTSTPDWTNHTRVVNRGEDIVINRDQADLERGEGINPLALEKSRSGTGSSSNTLETEKPTMVDSKELGKPQDNTTLPDYREQEPPDGNDTISEWVEGNHRVIERRAGPGDDVEVIVMNVDPAAPDAFVPKTKWRGHFTQFEREAEEIGHSIRRELRSLGHKAMGVVSPSRRNSREKLKTRQSSEQMTQPHEHAVADEDDDGWASEGTADEGVDEAVGKGGGKKKTRANRAFVHAHRTPRRPSFRRNSITGEPVGEDMRGRDGRPGTASTVGSTMIASVSSKGLPGPRSNFTRSSRPGTGDSMRHNRIESIRAQHGPPTRETSPSRSVRFVDESSRPGSSHGNGGGRTLGGDLSGRTLVDETVQEETYGEPSTAAKA